MSNAWAVGRDESLFDPALGHLHGFIPERWLVTGEATAWGKLRPELPLAVFRQGKRVCQGKRTAIDGAFMQISSLLWAYDIEPVDPVDYYDMVVVEFMTEVPVQVEAQRALGRESRHQGAAPAHGDLDKVMGITKEVKI